MTSARRAALVGLGFLMMVRTSDSRAAEPDEYRVVWDSPSADHHGSMPLGNGDIGVNAWVAPDGDLAFYIGKTDAWGDNARLLKVGKVRVRLEPPLVVAGGALRQELDLGSGTMRVSTTSPAGTTNVLLWVDAAHPVVQVTVDGPTERAAVVSIEPWRTERQALASLECSDVYQGYSGKNPARAATVVEPDTIITGRRDRIGWYHHNFKSVGPAMTAKIQGVSGYERPDPLLHRTFGGVVRMSGGERVDDMHMRAPRARAHRVSVYVLTRHPSTPAAWLGSMDRLVRDIERRGAGARRSAHEEWWRAFWARSWIHIARNELPSKAAAGAVPASSRPVRIGADQAGGNLLGGEIGRVSVFGAALSADEVAGLARVGRDATITGRGGLVYTGRPRAGDHLPGSAGWAFAGGLTLEAWVRPGRLGASGARIVDRITPGKSDGFLLDTYPGNSLRLIVGGAVVVEKDVLPADRWVHVAAVVGAGAPALYLDGVPLDGGRREEAVAGGDAFVVGRAYALQRFVDACAGRGRYPIKFNGSIFTVPHEGKPGDADYRRWGPGYWWQNTRLPYLSMCASGDFEMMEPLFRMYVDEVLPLCVHRTKRYFGHGGAYYPECIYFWGDMFSETYGWTPFEEREDKLQSSEWHKWEWVCGPELVHMMLECYEHTLDERLLAERVLPTAREVMRFFDEYYRTGEDGLLVMRPSMACETWWRCTNPMPELAGLRAIVARLLSLPTRLTTNAQRRSWREFQAKLPELPTREVEGGRALAPAEKFEMKRNSENPELYAVFPFRLASFEKPNAELGRLALKHRWDRGSSGWRQDDLFMAYLGLTADVRKNVVARARAKHGGSRFPAFWGPNYDWIPDQDHGGVLMKAVQAMLLQTDGKRIFLLPAWPVDWDVEFRLHAPYRTIVEGSVKSGRVVELRVMPRARERDVEIAGPFRR